MACEVLEAGWEGTGLFRTHFGGKYLHAAQTLPVAPLSVSGTGPRHGFPTPHLQSQRPPSCSPVLSLFFLSSTVPLHLRISQINLK